MSTSGPAAAHAGREHVPGQGVLSVGFDHRTSREGDPLLHTHLVVANRTQGPDGRWTALDGRDVYRHRLAADAIYRASYQRELSRSLGVEWTPGDTHGNRELQGIPGDLVRLFSKRSEQIDRAVGQLEADGHTETRARPAGPAPRHTTRPDRHRRAP
jgi:conjugative relaxase-like TrwC/TraI family protein